VDDLRVMFATTAMEDTDHLLKASMEKMNKASELYTNLGVERGSIHESLDVDEEDDEAEAERKRLELAKKDAMSMVTETRFTSSQIKAFDLFRSAYLGHRTRRLMTEQQAEHVAAARIQLKWWCYYGRRINAARRIQAWFRCMIFREILQGCMIAKQSIADSLRTANATTRRPHK
jgi:hypothetical protein